MPISFDGIPANLRTPGAYIEFNNELAGATVNEYHAVLVAQRLATGTKAAAEPVLVTDPDLAGQFFGFGSLAQKMAARFLAANTSIPLTVIALDDNPAGTAATGTITVSSTIVSTIN